MDKIKCVICGESFEEQFMDKHETLDGKIIIHVCDSCYDEEAMYDEYDDMIHINYNDDWYYLSSKINGG